MIINLEELIKSQHNKGFVGRGKKINDISNRATSIEEAKAKVQKILDSGATKRKKIKKRKKHKTDPKFENHGYIS